MISGNEEEIALAIRARDQNASATIRGVGSVVEDTAKRVQAANTTTSLSATQAAAALKQMGVAARVDAAGGIERVVVAAGDLDAAKNNLAAFGATAEIVAGGMTKAAVASEAAAARETAAAARVAEREAAAAERRIQVMGKLEVAAYQEAEVREQAAEREAAAATRAAEREIAADERRIQEMGKLEVAAYKEAAAMEAAAAQEAAAANAITPIDSKARSGANGMAVLSLAMLNGSGSAQSLALAAGLASSSILALSKNAKVAASANGIGALVTLLGVFYETAQKLDATDPIPQAFTERLAQQGLAAVRANVQSLKQERDNLLATLPNINAVDRLARLKDIKLLNDEINAAYARQVSLERDARKKAGEAERKDDDAAARERAAGMKAGQKELLKLLDEVDAAHNKAVASPDIAAALAVNRERTARDAEIREMDISESLKNSLLEASYRLRNEKLALLDKEIHDRQKKEARDVLDTINKAEATARAQKVATARSYIDQIVTAERLGARQLAGIALQPLISYLEGKAAQEAVDAYGSLGIGNIAGAAGHAAYAAAAIAAARKLSQIAGGGGGGSVSGGGGGASGGSDGFTPRNQGAGGGDIHITFLSEDQLSPGKVNALRFQINRADVLDKPIQYTAPGGSLTVRAA